MYFQGNIQPECCIHRCYSALKIDFVSSQLANPKLKALTLAKC